MSTTSEDLFFAIRGAVIHASYAIVSASDILVDKLLVSAPDPQAWHSLANKLHPLSWIPQSYRSTPAPPPPPPPPPPSTTPLASFIGFPFRKTAAWASRNRLLAAAVFGTLFASTAWTIHASALRRTRRKLKRRAPRAANNARTQVVVLAGYPHEHVTSMLALDLERRGFIIFIVVHTPEEEAAVLKGIGEGRHDIRPLMLDLASPEAQIKRFHNWLLSPQTAFEGAGKTGRYYLNLVGLVLVPALASYQAAPVEILDAGLWSDTVNINVLQPIAVARCFIPSLASFKGRIVTLQSAIVPPLAPPFCALETVVGNALSGWLGVLEREVTPFELGVSLIRVGNLEGVCQQYPSSSPTASYHHRTPSPATLSSRTNTPTWPQWICIPYARHLISSVANGPTNRGKVKGAPMRELYITVFDALGVASGAEKRKGKPRFIYRVGTGSRVYELLGVCLPRDFIGWMLGVGGWGSMEVRRGSRGAVGRLIGYSPGLGEAPGKITEAGPSSGGGNTTTPEWEKVDGF